jgi:hypothetical protein
LTARVAWQPTDPRRLPEVVAEWIAERPGRIRVAVDGPPTAGPHALALALTPLLERAGRAVAVVRADHFWRDASLRLEHGREDADAFLSDWLDRAALRREVLDAVAATGTYLPSLRDPATNRSTRAATRHLRPGGVLLVTGFPLLGTAGFDRTIHLAQSPATRARRMPPELVWTLPAFERYEAESRPQATADLVLKLDDPRHPALRFNRLT